MKNTKENRQAFLKKQFSHLFEPNEKKLLTGVRELNSVLSRKRKVIVITDWDELRGELRDELRDELKEEMWDELWGELWDELGDELREELWDELRDELRDELGDAYSIWEYYESIWPIFIRNFYPQLKTIKKNKKKIDALARICEAGNAYIWLSKKTMYVLPFPKITIDEDKKLHNTKKYACQFADKKTYWLHGIKFERKLWKQIVSSKVKIKDVLALENTEQRMVALKVVGVEKLLKKAKLLDKSKRGNELYLVEGVFRNPIYYLKFKDSSTDRVYVEGVKPEVGEKKDADYAQASAWGLTKEEYKKLEIET